MVRVARAVEGNRVVEKVRKYAERRCPECTGPNDFLVWVLTIKHDGHGDFVAPQTTFVHYYRCAVCNYDWQLTSPLEDPDKQIPKRVY